MTEKTQPALAGQIDRHVRPLVERLRSRAWEDRHHRKYREEAAARIEELEMELSEVLTWAKVEKVLPAVGFSLSDQLGITAKKEME
jgi:hypothetical protein